jgi:hypothetical protein
MEPRSTRKPRTKSATTAASPEPASIPTEAGTSAAPSDGSENSRAPMPRATT